MSIFCFFIFLGLFGGVCLNAGRLSNILKKYEKKENHLYLPGKNYIKLLTLDNEGLGADLFWIKGALYFGSHYRERDSFKFKWLYHILDLATDLDPHYYDVYWYGASLMPSVKESIMLLNKGRKYFPQDWKLPEMIGFYYHYQCNDYLAAGKYYEIAGRLPGHPPFVPSLAGRFYTEGGDITSALRVLKNFYDTCEKEDLKKDFGCRIKQLHDIDLLGKKAEIFNERFSRYPKNLEELITYGIINNIPSEPYQGSYFWDEKRKRVRSTTDPKL